MLIPCVLAQKIYQLGLPCLQSWPKNSGEYVTTAHGKNMSNDPRCLAALVVRNWVMGDEDDEDSGVLCPKTDWNSREPQCIARMNHVHFACRPWMRRTYHFLPVPATTRPLKPATIFQFFFCENPSEHLVNFDRQGLPLLCPLHCGADEWQMPGMQTGHVLRKHGSVVVTGRVCFGNCTNLCPGLCGVSI